MATLVGKWCLTRIAGSVIIIACVFLWSSYMLKYMGRTTIIWKKPIDSALAQNVQAFSAIEDTAAVINNMQDMRNHVAKSCKVLREKHMIPYDNRSSAPNNTDLPTRVMLSEDFKLISCKVLKVGSTNIRRVMFTLDHLGTLNDTNQIKKKYTKDWMIDIRPLDGEPLRTMRHKLNTYTKFMFVRDPIERLVSAYRDRKPQWWFKYRQLPASGSLSFNEFLVWVINTPTRYLNKHLKMYSTWCQPCSNNYDFIGRLSNFDEDMGMILESVGAKGLAILPERNQTNYISAKSSDVVAQFRRNVPLQIVKQIYEKYYVDYYLFGFPRPY